MEKHSSKHPESRLLTNFRHRISAKTKILIFVFGLIQKFGIKEYLDEKFGGGLHSSRGQGKAGAAGRTGQGEANV